jgi:signal transduction histidine kinase
MVGRNPAAADLVLTCVVALLALGQRFGTVKPGGLPVSPTGLEVALALAASAPIAWRRRYPLGVLAAVELVAVVNVAFRLDPRVTLPGAIVALYTVTTSCRRSAAAWAAVAVVAGNAAILSPSLLGYDLASPGEVSRPNWLFSGLVLAGSWVVGDNVRTRRAYTAELEERAIRLEREREEKAVRAVVEERARIARELHDVVAHHVSVIAVQAGAAAEEAVTDPAREALALIQTTSRQVLAELRSLLGVLRNDGAGPGLAPQPGLAQLDQLLAQSRAAGLAVELATVGEPRALPAIVDLAAYRIVQEGLTNTLRHAGAAGARIEIRYGRDVLEVHVTDDGRGAPARAGERNGGRGLLGMRERVALVGGALEVGPQPGGGFRVAALLPIGEVP